MTNMACFLLTFLSILIGPAASLFQAKFFELMKNALHAGGIICTQCKLLIFTGDREFFFVEERKLGKAEKGFKCMERKARSDDTVARVCMCVCRVYVPTTPPPYTTYLLNNHRDNGMGQQHTMTMVIQQDHPH